LQTSELRNIRYEFCKFTSFLKFSDENPISRKYSENILRDVASSYSLVRLHTDQLYEPLDRWVIVQPKLLCWELTGGVVSSDGDGYVEVLAAFPVVFLAVKVADDVRLSEAVLGVFSLTSSASWGCGYGRMECSGSSVNSGYKFQRWWGSTRGGNRSGGCGTERLSEQGDKGLPGSAPRP
jgi:hypothetical protein